MKFSALAVGCLMAGLFAGCGTTRQTTSADKNKNNVISSSQTNTVSTPATETSATGTKVSGKDGGGNDEVIFKGSNNLFDIISKNAAYFDQHHEVIIIEGDNNIIRLYNINLVDMRGPGSDTLIIVGNQQKYVIAVSNTISLKKQPSKTETIRMETTPIPATTFTSDFNRSESMQNLLDNYKDGLAAGDADTYFRLAKVYHFGLDEDLEPSLAKAIDLYEFAAVKNHLESIRALGEIYANEKPDKLKAIYFFTLGANQEDGYSRERLIELRGKK